MLTDLEAVFRSLKSELGLRPIYHRLENRVNGHIFITLLAYHAVQTLRAKMENQQRVTVVMKRADGKTIHLRKATRAEPHQETITMRSVSQCSRVLFKKQLCSLSL